MTTAERVSYLPVVETFTTLQGEGPAAGQRATFIRLGGCNLSCSWCDSAYTWDGQAYDLREEIRPRTVEDVLDRVDARIVVLTGGEPLLHQRSPAWRALLEALTTAGRQVHLETNGTIPPTADTLAHVSLASVSPKLAHAEAWKRTGAQVWRTDVLTLWPAGGRALLGRAFLKIVVQDGDDCDAAVLLADEAGWPRSAVWLMPEGTTAEVLNRRWPLVCEKAIAAGCNATHRLHVLAWGDERGH